MYQRTTISMIFFRSDNSSWPVQFGIVRPVATLETPSGLLGYAMEGTAIKSISILYRGTGSRKSRVVLHLHYNLNIYSRLVKGLGQSVKVITSRSLFRGPGFVPGTLPLWHDQCPINNLLSTEKNVHLVCCVKIETNYK